MLTMDAMTTETEKSALPKLLTCITHGQQAEAEKGETFRDRHRVGEAAYAAPARHGPQNDQSGQVRVPQRKDRRDRKTPRRMA